MSIPESSPSDSRSEVRIDIHLPESNDTSTGRTYLLSDEELDAFEKGQLFDLPPRGAATAQESSIVAAGYSRLLGIARGLINLVSDVRIHQVASGENRPEVVDRSSEGVREVLPRLIGQVTAVNRGVTIPEPIREEITAVAQEVAVSPHPCSSLLQIAESIVEHPSADALGLMQGVLRDFQKVDFRLSKFIHRNIITPRGCDLILEKLREKSGPLEARTCSSAEEWGRAIQDIYASDEDYSGSFIVNATPDRHLSHVHVTKSDDSFDIFYTDSMGYEPSYLSALPNQVQQLKGRLPIHSYLYKKERQADGSNCPVFSIRDAVKMCRDPSLRSFIKENSSEQGSRGNTMEHEILVLPPDMMKVTQSMTRLSYYIRERGAEVDSYKHLIKVKDDSGNVVLRSESFRENIDKHIFKDCAKKQNKLIEHRFNKYATMILRHLVQNPSS